MMSTHSENNNKDYEDPAAGYTWMIGLIGTVLLVVTVLGTVALYYNIKAAEVEVVVNEPTRIDVENLRNMQRKVLKDRPRWVEREDEGGDVKKYLAIPIDRAVELVIEEYGNASASAFDTDGD